MDKMKAMRDALRARQLEGMDMSLLLGEEEKDEKQEMDGLAPDATPIGDLGVPTDEDEMSVERELAREEGEEEMGEKLSPEQESFIETELSKGHLGRRSMFGKLAKKL